jgi:hypothetical protein
MAEHAIFLVKRRIYQLMSSKKTKNWPKYLAAVIQGVNNKPNPYGIIPSTVHSFLDDDRLRAAKEKKGVDPEANNWRLWEKNQRNYEKNPNNKLQVGTFVFLKDKKPLMFKSGQFQVSEKHLFNG